MIGGLERILSNNKWQWNKDNFTVWSKKEIRFLKDHTILPRS